MTKGFDLAGLPSMNTGFRVVQGPATNGFNDHPTRFGPMASLLSTSMVLVSIAVVPTALLYCSVITHRSTKQGTHLVVRAAGEISLTALGD